MTDQDYYCHLEGKDENGCDVLGLYAILTEATKLNARLDFKSYDRFFPNQDRLPEGGFGNLVALPLQGRARNKNVGGNTL